MLSETHVLLVSAAFALFLALVTSALQIAGVISLNLARLLLASAWAVAVIGVCGSLQNAPAKHLLIAGVTTAIPVGIGLIVLERWVSRHVHVHARGAAKGSSGGGEIKPPPQPFLNPQPPEPQKPAPTQKPSDATPQQRQRDLGAGSGAPPYVSRSMPAPTMKWTDYKEDYFYGAIWRWEWRPEMGDRVARKIVGLCPECDGPLKYHEDPRVTDGGSCVFSVYCGKHLGKWYYVHTPTRDPRDGIQELIHAKLDSGEWKQVVSRQREARGYA